MQVPVHNIEGKIVDQIEMRDDIFSVPFNEALVHQAFVRQLANKRQGTASTKTRAEIVGSTKKLFPQKHTGRARRGNIKSPLLRGGGVVFGPNPRSYRQLMPKKMRCLALKCVLSAKAMEGAMILVEGFGFESPNSKKMISVLSALGINSSVLIVTGESEPSVVKSARNLNNVKVLPSALINVLDLLSHKTLLPTVTAIHNIEQIWSVR